ncbi:hypothetical protein DYBT9275_02922 [Dyadobacter sp. CECT 9275]|uniref:TIR domain-containing protein n=1 Tax=Dyadobacter helix TaxID=2822344 RepID=A0A916JCM1_9BACT|nr:TIR domain-containing protein [Dyadobacter sp. CECT 9275]CAG5002580.1 hypothetical protein DYBT9275_02922 [Dyadobacter sp. CECT 9275]
MKYSPWFVDADRIQIGYSTTGIESFLTRTNSINKFLSPQETNKYFLVGPKGLGKTLLLKLKSLQLREKSYKVIPESTLCEKINDIVTKFSYESIHDLETERMWKIIWEISLCCCIARNCNVSLPEEISRIIGLAKSLSSILKIFLSLGTKNIEKLYNKFNDTQLRPIVDNLHERGVSQLALFIDNIDEGFSSHVGEAGKTNSENTYLVSAELWIAAQIAILGISKRLMQANPHLKIYVSIRSEAFNQIVAQEKKQIGDLCTFLEYSKEQIKDIFLKNIRETDSDNLVFPSEKDAIKSFLGFTGMPHRFVRDEKGEKVVEDVFDFIYRHTFGRPREIVAMGERISNISPNERNMETIHNAINNESSELFKQLTLEIIPSFDIDIFRKFINIISKNIFSRRTAEIAYKYFAENEKFKHICSYYWNLGILGIVKQNGADNSRLIQAFRPVGQYSLAKDYVPEYKSFLMHPATYSLMEEVLYDRANFFSLENIVGYDNIFIEARSNYNRIRYHLHLGMGRDSLSILVPTLHNHKILGIVINPSNNIWNELSLVEYFELRVDEDVFKFRVYRDEFEAYRRDQIFREWIDDKQATIFFTGNKELINNIASNASAITTTDYEDIKFLETIGSSVDNNNKIIYLCKRTFDTARELDFKNKLFLIHPSWKLRKVLIDRYTLSSKKSVKNQNLLCEIEVEEYPGKQVSLYHDQLSVIPNGIVRRPKSKEEFDFYEREFRLLREGIYQYYKLLRQKGLIRQGSQDCLPRLRLFASIQIEGLLSGQNRQVLNEVFGRDDRPSIRKELMNECLIHFKRLDALEQSRLGNNGQSVNISELKRTMVLLSNVGIYDFVKLSRDYIEAPSLCVDVLKDLQVYPIKKYFSTFISYSFRDTQFASTLANYLILNGVKVEMFEIDDPKGKLLGIMSEYVKKNEKMIFLSSRNSLISSACHFELKTCREKISKNWKEMLIPIRIDDYILEIQEYDIPSDKRSLFWENIIFIKENNVHDFSKHSALTDKKLFEAEILEKILNKYLKAK